MMVEAAVRPDQSTVAREQPLRLAVIIGSTREGRRGDSIGKWFVQVAQQHPGVDLDLVDLAEVRLPVVLPETDEGISPEVTDLAGRLAAADGFVVVTPEYNHSFPASLKNAIDWFYAEWQAKPVSFVSYGGGARGVRAVEHLRQVFAELHAVTTQHQLGFELGGEDCDASGSPVTSERTERRVEATLAQLMWWARALRQARDATPYPG